MKLPRYELKAEESLMIYEFISEGHKGEIIKLIKFSETTLKDFFNLAFGDKNKDTGEISDTVVSDNGDTEMVLATVERLFMLLQIANPICGFTLPVAQNPELGYIEWEFPNL